MQSVLWIPFFLTLLMMGLLVMQTHDGSSHLDAQETIVLALYFSFLVLAEASTLIQGGITATIVAFKNEIALSLMIICLLPGFCRESQIYRTTHHLYWVFYAQIPIMAYQVLLVVPQRVVVHGEDKKQNSMVDTFGGDPMGGEDTAAMGLFCLSVTLLKVSEYKRRLTTFRFVTLHIVLSIGLCITGEVKFVTLLSPIFLAWVWLSPSYIKDVSKVSLKTLLVIVAGTLLLISLSIMVLAYCYFTTFDGDPSRSSLSIFTDSLSYIFDPNYIIFIDELGCFMTFLLWSENNDLQGLSGTLFGYGLSATNSGSMVSPDFLNIICNLILNLTSLGMLLWEVGVVNTLFFISLFIYILEVCQPKPLLMFGQLDQQGLQLLSFAPAFSAFVISRLISLPYNQILMIISMLQFLFCLSPGSSLVIRRTILCCVG